MYEITHPLLVLTTHSIHRRPQLANPSVQPLNLRFRLSNLDQVELASSFLLVVVLIVSHLDQQHLTHICCPLVSVPLGNQTMELSGDAVHYYTDKREPNAKRKIYPMSLL